METLFYNTIAISGEELKAALSTCHTQREKILKFFELSPLREFTVYEVYRIAYRERGILKTSCGRTITSLMNEGLLEITGKRMELYGKMNFTYKLKNNQK